MSKKSGWVPLDKNLQQEFKHINRPFSRIEAMYSYTLDADNGSAGSIKGYAKLWGWSRNKARKFIQEIRTREGHFGNTIRTRYGHPIHFIDKGLWSGKDRIRTGEGHDRDTIRYPTTNPNPNPKEGKDSDFRERKSPPCPHQQIINLFSEELPQLPQPKVKLWNGKRANNLRARWNEDPERQSLEWWQDYFSQVSGIPFLLGQNDRGWKADIGWLVEQKNMVKVLEGNYSRHDSSGSIWEC